MLTQTLPDMDYSYYNPVHDTILAGYTKDRRGQWTVLFFYPADFTFVCPTELEDLMQYEKNFDTFSQTKLYVVSSDSVEVHKQWIKDAPKLHGFPYYMIGDRNHHLSQYFQVYNEATGNAYRATIIIDPRGTIVSYDMVINEIGRGSREVVRRLAALQYTYTHAGQLCPSSREPGDAVIVPGECKFNPEDFFVHNK